MPKRRTARPRALIYVRGTAEEIDQQLTNLTEACVRRGYEVAGIARDDPGDTRGYHDAHRMLRHGDADLILVSSTTVLPDVLESATGSLPGPRVREIVRRTERRRRIRPIRRVDGAA